MAGFQINSATVSWLLPTIESINSQGVVAISNPNGEITGNDVTAPTKPPKQLHLPTEKEIIHIIPPSFSVDGQDGILDQLV
jgi:cell division protein FtsA